MRGGRFKVEVVAEDGTRERMIVTATAELPSAQVVRFYPRRGLGYRHEKDHLALDGIDKTLCGIALDWPRSSGTHMQEPFDAEANYSCKRCVAALRRTGPVRVSWRISWYSPLITDVVRAPHPPPGVVQSSACRSRP